MNASTTGEQSHCFCHQDTIGRLRCCFCGSVVEAGKPIDVFAYPYLMKLVEQGMDDLRWGRFKKLETP